ncbi:cytochrome c [Methylomarinum sp. Ch1-1]|uniref:Cytochrome c n=1 Tax=Methylomarinum roseum TaxID=3067653 RepID=A0AAU7NYK2_9GAMM
MRSTMTISLSALAIALIAGCSRDYDPAPEASGEQIYQAACIECHPADEKGIIFHIDSKNANPTYIAHKVKTGSLMMPKFPNIKAEDLKKLSAYALEHSASK